MKDSKYYRKKMKEYKKSEEGSKVWLTKMLLSIIIVLVCLIATNFNGEVRNIFKKNVLEDTIDFGEINNFYKKFIGGNKEEKDSETIVVNEEKGIDNLERKDVDGSYEINVGVDYPVTFLESGIIVYIGDKDNYNDTVIIQGNDGVDIWYSNVSLNEYSLYDYVSKGDILGVSLDEIITITIMKDGNKLTYEEYFE